MAAFVLYVTYLLVFNVRMKVLSIEQKTQQRNLWKEHSLPTCNKTMLDAKETFENNESDSTKTFTDVTKCTKFGNQVIRGKCNERSMQQRDKMNATRTLKTNGNKDVMFSSSKKKAKTKNQSSEIALWIIHILQSNDKKYAAIENRPRRRRLRKKYWFQSRDKAMQHKTNRHQRQKKHG